MCACVSVLVWGHVYTSITISISLYLFNPITLYPIHLMDQLVGPALGLCIVQCVNVSMIGMAGWVNKREEYVNVHGLPNKG